MTISQNLIKKSIESSILLFPEHYSARKSYQSFHFAFAWKRNKLLAIGINRMTKTSPIVKRIAQKFGNKKNFYYPSIHAEIDCLSRLISMEEKICSKIKLCVIRLNKFGDLGNSKPCKNCQDYINALNIKDVWFTE